jgi:large subunit ribosomal protein L22
MAVAPTRSQARAVRSQARAVAKWVRIAPRKARLVADHIRGRTVPEARTILAFSPQAAARELEKVLRSAVANAEANHGLIGDELVVSTASVDDGVTLKRWRAQARGRAHRIRKRTCHITITLTTLGEEVETPAVEEAPPPAEQPEAEAQTAEADVEEEAVAEQPAEDEQPKRRRRAQAEPPEGAAETDEEKPKRRRRRKADTEGDA